MTEPLDFDIQVVGIDNDGSAIYRAENGDTWVDGLHFLEIESI